MIDLLIMCYNDVGMAVCIYIFIYWNYLFSKIETKYHRDLIKKELTEDFLMSSM